MPTNGLLIALGVPAGQYLMPDGTIEYQVLYGDGTWGLTKEEYNLWNAVRRAPQDFSEASLLARSLHADEALYLYDPETPDSDFMRHHRIAPMGRPIGPVPHNMKHYLILTTNGRQPLTCDTHTAQIWLHWWRGQPLSAFGEFSVNAVWQTIPWAISNNLGYLIPCQEATS